MGTKAYTTVDHLSTKQISEAWIALPPLGEQERIVAKFDELMSMCDQLEAAKAERDALRTAARKSAIDAVSTASTPDELSAAWARIRDNWATYADTPESISSLRSLILDLAVQGRLTQSNVDNWVSATLGEAASYVQRGKSPKYAPNSAVPVVSQKCVKWSGFDIQEARFIDTSTIDSYQPERFLINGDLLWNSTGTGTVGRTALFIESHEYEQVVADSHVTVVRVPDVDPRFLWMWSASPQIQTQVLSSTTGSTNQQELNLSTIKALVIHIPPPEEQQMIVRHVDLLMALCDQLESELSTRNDLAKWWAASVVHHLGDAA
jgi:type I restriction enzyme S subunit